MPKYTDIKMQGDDIATDASGQPIQIYDRDVIAQDIGHAIRESGLLELLIAERSKQKRELIHKQLRMIIENDTRIDPGTSEITEATANTLNITADSEFGKISIMAGI